MAESVTVASLLERNARITETWEPLPTFAEAPMNREQDPNVLIITCVDPRCDPHKFLGLNTWDAIVMRNVCGHVDKLVPDIVALDILIGFKELVVIHHDDCGATHFTDEAIRTAAQAWYPDAEALARVNFGAITDVNQSITDDLKVIKESGMIRPGLRDSAVGFAFGIKTGKLTRVGE